MTAKAARVTNVLNMAREREWAHREKERTIRSLEEGERVVI